MKKVKVKVMRWDKSTTKARLPLKRLVLLTTMEARNC